MMLHDTPQNSKILYLFVNKFDWGSNQQSKENSLGHPKSQRLYRAVHNTETDSYRIVHTITRENCLAVYIENLQNIDETLGYTSDIKRVTLDSILDFNIPEEDLDSLLLWLDTDDKELKGAMGWIKPSAKATPVAGPSQMTNLPEVDEDLLRFIDMGDSLSNKDPALFGTVIDLLDYLLRPSDDAIIDTTWVKFDKKHGAGANISAAIQKLSRYIGTDRKTNMEADDLMGAIKELLTEQIRRNFNEL